MAQDGKILRSDVSEKDPFILITESAIKATAQVENLKKDLELILPATQKLLESKATTVEAINKQAKAMEVLANRQKEARLAQEQATKAEQTYEKARVAQIKLEQAREKAMDNYEKKLVMTEKQTLRNAKAEEKARVSQIKLEQAREKAMDNYEKKLVMTEKQTLRNAKAEERLKSSYFKVQDGLTSLANRYRELAVRKEMGETLSAKEELRLGRLQALTLKYDAALKKVDADMGRHQRNVGNYASGWNGLGNSVNQLTREMPAFAVSMNTGFLALSNNIPMLFDELSRIKKVNADIIKDGGKAESMWSQLGKSIFSFQTLLSLGVTLLTIYGSKLIEAVKGIGGYVRELTNAKNINNLLNVEIEKNIESVAKERAVLDTLLDVAKDETQSKENRLKAINKLNEIVPEYNGNLSLETVNTDEARIATNKYIVSLNNKAKAQAAMNMKTELYGKLLTAQMQGISGNMGVWDVLTTPSEWMNIIKGDVASFTIKAAAESGKRQVAIQQEIDALDKYLRSLGLQDEMIDENVKTTVKSVKARKEHLETLKREEYEFSKLIDIQKKYEGIQSPEKLARILALEDERATRIANIAIIQAELNLLTAKQTKDADSILDAEQALLKAKLQQLEVQKRINVANSDNPAQTEEIEAQYELDKKRLEQNEKEVEGIERKGKVLEAVAKLTKEVNDIVTEYFNGKLTNEIEMLDNYLAIVNKNYDYLADKAAQGNLQAQESLKAQLRLQKELNDEKIKAQEKLQKLQAVSGIIGGIGSLAGSIQGFETGTESEIKNYVKPNLKGVGIDNTLVRVHGDERIINGGLSKAITGHKTSEVVQGFLNYKQMANGQVGYVIDNSETNRLLREIASKPTTEYQLGEITQTMMEVWRKETNGNKEVKHIYKSKFR